MVETDDGVGLGLQGGEAPRSVAASPTVTPASGDPSDAGCPPPVLPGERQIGAIAGERTVLVSLPDGAVHLAVRGERTAELLRQILSEADQLEHEDTSTLVGRLDEIRDALDEVELFWDQPPSQRAALIALAAFALDAIGFLDDQAEAAS
jgi:hypothetical protein